MEAVLCGASVVEARDRRPQDLYIFAHGGGLFPEDYQYVCSLPGVTARLVTPPGDGPMDLQSPAAGLCSVEKKRT